MIQPPSAPARATGREMQTARHEKGAVWRTRECTLGGIGRNGIRCIAIHRDDDHGMRLIDGALRGE
jgi:hypothetical protein